ncbi:MAG: Panacea domain-containing protein [Thermodesulfobacteriota bacterium]
MKIAYQPNHRKILETLAWVASKRPGKDFHFILKVLFYADKAHLQEAGRPVIGDTYIKMTYGPVPSHAYDMLESDDHLPERLLELISSTLDVVRVGRIPHVTAKRSPELSFFSGSDIRCLEKALEQCDGMDFNSLCVMTHAERAWIDAQLNGEMDYANFIDEDTEDREELIAYIRETAPTVAL